MLIFFNKEVHLYFLETLRLLWNMYYICRCLFWWVTVLRKKLVSWKKLTSQKFMQSFFTIQIGDTSHIKLYEDSLLLKSARRRWCVIATLSLPPARSSWGLHELFSRAESYGGMQPKEAANEKSWTVSSLCHVSLSHLYQIKHKHGEKLTVSIKHLVLFTKQPQPFLVPLSPFGHLTATAV